MESELNASAYAAAAIFLLPMCAFLAYYINRMIQIFKELPRKCEGFAAPGWNRVAEAFKRHVEVGDQRGGGIAVYHKGQLVVEFVGGYADYKAERPWDKTTLTCVYGCTKGIGAIVVAILVDRGLLDYSAPVADYWPEFAVNGKESITVEQLLSNQAGLIVLDENYSFFDIIKKPDKMSHLLATAQPQWEPGSQYGFHSMTIGLYMDQLVRKVDPDHRSLAEFFMEEVSRKFGVDCFIGLPEEENYRCARLQGFPRVVIYLSLHATGRYPWEEEEHETDHFKKSFSNLVEDGEEVDEDDPAFRAIPCVASNGYATAAGLARLYGILANGGCHENQTLLSPSAVERLNEPLMSGVDSVHLLDSTVGRGTVIMKSEDGHDIFGYAGFCAQAGFADPKHRLGWACISNSPWPQQISILPVPTLHLSVVLLMTGNTVN